MKTYEKTVLPSQCTMIFGVPLDQKGFREALTDPRRDFVRNCCPVWPLYRQEVVAPGESLLATARSLGAVVIERATLVAVKAACNARTPVVIVVSHWAGGTVEFYDQMHPMDTIVQAIPDDYDGFVDLLMCIPRPLALALRDSKPDCLIRYAEAKVRPRLWFPYFEALFHRLSVGDLSYLDSSREVLLAFMTH